jgi:hypothetical protein
MPLELREVINEKSDMIPKALGATSASARVQSLHSVYIFWPTEPMKPIADI